MADFSRGAGLAERPLTAAKPPSALAPSPSVIIRIGPLRWVTLPVGGRPALAAVREVTTPEERLVQGFVIAGESVREALRGAAFPAVWEPATAAEGGAHLAAAPVAETGWRVAVDFSEAVARAGARAGGVERDFLRLFAGGLAVALMAGACVVTLAARAERLARQRSRFAASAAHELRTPLAGLRLYGEMLAEGLGDPAKSGDYARRIASEAERLGRVIANVLGFTRLERGSLSVRPLPGDLAAAVREALHRQADALELAGMALETALPGELPPVAFDADALGVIVQNLLDNAEKHTRGAARRRVRVELCPAWEERDGAGEKSGSAAAKTFVCLSVIDHGPGIPGSLLRRLFRPFVRGELADMPPGLGLGLAMARALAEAHGGRLTHAKTPGGGATFRVFLPV